MIHSLIVKGTLLIIYIVMEAKVIGDAYNILFPFTNTSLNQELENSQNEPDS